MKTLIIGLMLLSSICFANPLATDLIVGEPAPFDGFLFNVEGLQKLTLDKDFEIAKLKLEISTTLEVQKNNCDYQLALKDIVIKGLTEELLERPIAGAEEDNTLYMVVGASSLLVGVVAGLLIGD